MKYINYNTEGKIFSISEQKGLGLSIEVQDSEIYTIKQYLRDPKLNVIVKDGSLVYSESLHFKRKKIVDFKNKKLKESDFLISDMKAREYLNLTNEDLDDLNEYRDRLRQLDDHFDNSKDKESWSFVFVDTYTSGKNTNKYQIVKPHFIK